MTTVYHAKYLAHELTKRCPSDSLQKLAATLADAQVDLNPHSFVETFFELVRLCGDEKQIVAFAGD
jgi:hypothetical protein